MSAAEIGLTDFDPMPYGYRRWNGTVWSDSNTDAYNRELRRIEIRHNAGGDVTRLVDGLYNLAATFDNYYRLCAQVKARTALEASEDSI